jgi:hypothetical protein
MIVLSTKQIKIRRNRICDYCLDLSVKGAYMTRIEAVGGIYYMCPYCEIIKIVEAKNKLFDVVGTE